MQCHSLGSRKVCCMLLFNFALFSNFLLCMFCLTNIVFVQWSPFGSRSLLHAFVVSNLFRILCLTNIGLVQCFSLRLPLSLHPFAFLCFNEFAFVRRVLPTSSSLCSDFSPAPLEFARLIFYFVLFSFNVVFCVLSLTNLIFLRFP